MATLQQAQEQTDVVRGFITLAQGMATEYFDTLGDMSAAVVREAFKAYLPVLLEDFGEWVSSSTLDYYELLRSEHTDLQYFDLSTLPLIGAPSEERIDKTSRWAVDPLTKEDLEDLDALKRFHQAIDEYLQEVEGETIKEAMERDPDDALFMRLLEPGADHCKLCIIAASRGAVYLSEKTAGGLEDWHLECKCEIIPVWKPEDIPADYDLNAVKEMYKNL